VGLICRLVTSMTVLLALLGLPVASVVCDLICPQRAVIGGDAERPARITSTADQAPCHEGAASAPERGEAVSPDENSAAGTFAATHAHGCDHPSVVASRAASDGLRLVPPQGITIGATMHLAPQRSPHAQRARLAPASAPPSGASGAYSPVLRI